ncbi:MAG: sigma-70 family RNA polymerase sigma factor [Candidatus Pacebacteria bacterium]|nr:sigma-70 family RNA polymerase sigma factor [Candidatus Paceibacterota bacterium]
MPPPIPHTDEELVHLSLTNKEEFGVLVERYAPKLRNYIGRLGSLQPEDTEDVLQETFVRVYQNLNDFDDTLKFSSWIYRIAHNQTMTFFRKRRARPEGHAALLGDTELAALASESDVFTELAAVHDAHKLQEVLRKLPRDQYEILILRFFEHKSYDEISDILSLAPGTVAARINRAKAKIRQIMNTKGYTYG